MVEREKKIAQDGRFGYRALMRQYRRRFALAPTRAPSRRELIEEAAYAAAEADGVFAPERADVALAAIYYLLGALAATRGVELQTIARNLGDWDAIRPRAYAPPTPEEQAARDDEETRRSFAPWIKRALRMSNAPKRTPENNNGQEQPRTTNR